MTEPTPATPDFTTYTKDHWSCLLYIEHVVVEHDGIPDYRKMNEADRDAAEEMERDGLLVWGGTGMHPIFSLTDAGWAVAGALRRHRAEKGEKDQRAKVAAAAIERLTAQSSTSPLDDPRNRTIVENAREACRNGHTRRKAPRKPGARDIWLAAYDDEAARMSAGAAPETR